MATTSTYDYGNLTTPVRSYSNTYLYQGNTNYSSRYVYSRLATSTLTSASPNVTLVQNVYDGGTINTTATLPNEWDIVNYPASFIYRGNVTQANTPGKTVNTTYDYTGTVVSQNDNNGHSVNVATSTATNYTLPDTLSPNGSTTLQTQAQYTTAGYFPGSVAGPNQSIYNPTSAPNGTAAYTGYDTFGRVNLTLAPSQVAGQAAGAQTNYSYGYVSSAWTIKATTTNSSGSSHFTTTVLDGLGRTASVQTGTGSTTLSEVDTLYAPCACSPLGKMYQQTQPYAPPNSSPPATTYTYDALGRTVSVLLPDGASQTTYAYQGNFTTVTDPAGNWKQYATDALGNLVMVLEPDPTHSPVVGPPTPSTYPVTSAPTGTLLTTYTYDQFNHLTQVSMPRTTGYGLVTQTRTFAYASTAYASLTLPAVWLTSATNPESGTTSYTYNADGTLASKKDANGNTETYTYDAYQRLTGIPDRNQYFTYDTCPSGVTICANAPGQLMEAIFASGVGTNELGFTYGYAYTPAGKVASKSLMVQSANHLGGSVQASGTLTASYGYDGQGALVSQQYPISQTWASGTSNTFTYTLDALERPTQMTDSTQKTWASGATYNAANQPLYDGTATRTYNNLLQMTSIVASGLNMTYNYSATKNNGQITSSVDGISGETITYAYDALKRLSGASSSASWSAGYTFDGYGNLLGIAGSGGPPSISLTAAVNANNVPTNQIQATGVTYDNNGNQTAGFGGLTFSYDAANRMVGVGGSASEAYWYDSSNLRVYSRNASGAETIYFYGADGTKLATYTYSIITYSGGPEIQLTQQSANVYFLGKLISAEGNAVQVDRLGSVRSGGPGGLGHQAEYPYGVEYSETANDREKYATYTRDSITGMDYAMNRYYTSQWGRFTSPDQYGGSTDPGSPQGWNRYAYVGGDPVNSTDPSGLYGQPPDGPDGPGGPGGPGGPVFGINPGGGSGWGFGGSGCDGLPDAGNWYDGGAGLPWWTFGTLAPWCGQFFPQPGAPPGGGGRSNPCNSPGYKNAISFVHSNLAAAQGIAEATGIPVQFILATSAAEVGWGGNAVSTEDNNFFDLRLSAKANPATATGGWAGAVQCNTLGHGYDAGWACFGLMGAFYDSGISAFTSFNDKYENVVLSALTGGASYASAAQAMAKAGYDPGNQSYGTKFQGALNVLNKIANCP